MDQTSLAPKVDFPADLSPILAEWNPEIGFCSPYKAFFHLTTAHGLWYFLLAWHVNVYNLSNCSWKEGLKTVH